MSWKKLEIVLKTGRLWLFFSGSGIAPLVIGGVK